MAGVLDGVNQRTQLVGQNRLELLLFRLGGKQRFGINVFKVQEVIHCPPLNSLPRAHHTVRGVATIRGRTFPVIDLAAAIGKSALGDPKDCFVIVTEFNRSIQGFLVDAVEHIINMNWEDILPPPKGTGKKNFMTAVTRVDDELVEIIDVEHVLSNIMHLSTDISDDLIEDGQKSAGKHILVADDSSVARNQIKRTLEQLGVECTIVNDGKEALEKLKEWAKEGPISEKLDMVISDIEMPEMDGYTLTAEIRENPQLQGLYVLLHSSLSGVFNSAMVEKVGANEFIAKFSADDLGRAVIDRLEQICGTDSSAAAG
ncbi:MAG: chemotaxis protein CheV [Gammaproteobacteria bacterium]|nr:chemotaxis protein CheV [Gammaproteobacteria bacterium]